MNGLNGLKITGLNQEADRVSVQSSEAPTFALTRRRFPMLPAKAHEVNVSRDEMLVIKARGSAEVRLQSLGGPHGPLIVTSSRRAPRVLREGDKVDFEIDDGEALIVRTEAACDPVRGHSAHQGAV